MTVSSVDTAELPRIGRWAGSAPLLEPAPTAPPAVQPLCRAELRAERRYARRQQRLFVLLGLSVLFVALVATVAVLDVIR